MIATDCKCYLSYLNKLVDEYNNTYHHSISRKSIDTDYSAFIKKLKGILELLSLKLVIKAELLSKKFSLSKSYTKNWLKLILFWKLLLGRIKLKT